MCLRRLVIKLYGVRGCSTAIYGMTAMKMFVAAATGLLWPYIEAKMVDGCEGGKG
jgi:hypothetical protein